MFSCIGVKRCVVPRHFILTAKFKWEISKDINSFCETMFMIDLRTAQLIAIKDPICLMDWVMYQSAFSVSDFYFPEASITMTFLLTFVRPTDCRLVPTFLWSSREIFRSIRRPSSWSQKAYKLFNRWTGARCAFKSTSCVSVKHCA